MYKIFNNDNMNLIFRDQADLVFADMIYENLDFSWATYYWDILKFGGIFIVMTDWHSAAEIKVHINSLPDANLVNWIIWKNEFGNFPKNKFRQCHDDILIFTNGACYKFRSDRIQVDKVTKSKGLNPSGRETKQATAWVDDICLTTTSKERIKKSDGHLVQWQKPIKLFDRIIAPFTDKGDNILDPFMGSGSLGEWSIRNNRNYVGSE